MGSLENLVTSELIYMDPPSSSGMKGDVDLFDMRYVEGELLYYTRDEAIFVRRRRQVVLVLSPDLVRARVKDRGAPFQRIVIVLGLVLVLTKKLVEMLGEEALAIRVVFLLAEDGLPSPLAEERALAELILREWRDLGTVEVDEVSWEETLERATTDARRALVEIVRFTGRAEAAPVLDPRIVFVDFPARPDALDEWSRRASEALSALL